MSTPEEKASCVLNSIGRYIQTCLMRPDWNDWGHVLSGSPTVRLSDLADVLALGFAAQANKEARQEADAQPRPPPSLERLNAAIREAEALAARHGLGSTVGAAFAPTVRPGRTITEGSCNTGVFGKSFTRAEVLAVLKSRKVVLEDRPHFAEAVRELDTLVGIFERME